MSLVNRGGYEHECSLCGVEWSGDHPPTCDANKGRPCDRGDVLAATTVAVSKMVAQIDEARDVAAILAHAYLTDNRPPREALTKANAWLRANQEAADD